MAILNHQGYSLLCFMILAQVSSLMIQDGYSGPAILHESQATGRNEGKGKPDGVWWTILTFRRLPTVLCFHFLPALARTWSPGHTSLQGGFGNAGITLWEKIMNLEKPWPVFATGSFKNILSHKILIIANSPKLRRYPK